MRAQWIACALASVVASTLGSGCVGIIDGGSGDDGGGDGSRPPIGGGDGDGDGDGGSRGDDGDGAGETGDDDVPSAAYCDPTAGWDGAQAAAEDEVLRLVNQHRSRGARCGGQEFVPTTPLEMDPALHCAARVHTLDMAERDYFDHQNPDGKLPWDRMEAAGYGWSNAGENIAGGADDPAGAVAQWMGSSGHCANIMSPDFRHIGVGYVADARLWTQVFGSPR